MEFTRAIYTAATRMGVALAPALVRGEGKVGRSVQARRDALERFVAWGGAERNPELPLWWFHAPSVGEGLQARAVMEAMQAEGGRESGQWVFTHFSPSAEGLAARMPVDFAGYLPWDLPGGWSRVLDSVCPSVIVFTKTEVWPNLVAEADRRRIPTVLTAATLPETSSRRRWPARALLHGSLRRLAAVHAIAEPDARGFMAVGARPEAVRVLGDPGIDSAAERVRGTDPMEPWLAPLLADRPPTLVAGSTWGAGEAVLLPAITEVRERIPGLRVVVAPHEPTPDHLELLEGLLREAGWNTRRLGEVEKVGSVGDADAIVVDRVGVLAGLYRAGDLAYVGGGYGTDGLHSVLEPAAAGCPVLIGPAYRSSAAAIDLVANGGARVADGAEAMSAQLLDLLGNDAERASASRAVSRYIDGHVGAAARCASDIQALTSDTSRR